MSLRSLCKANPTGMVYFLMAVLLLHERRTRSFQVAFAGLFLATASMLLH